MDLSFPFRPFHLPLLWLSLVYHTSSDPSAPALVKFHLPRPLGLFLALSRSRSLEYQAINKDKGDGEKSTVDRYLKGKNDVIWQWIVNWD